MRIGLFRRSASYLIDIIPIITVITLLLSWFVGDMIKLSIHEDFYRLETMYNENLEKYNEITDPYYEQYENGDITYDEYVEIVTPIQDDFIHNHTYIFQIVFINYWIFVALYIFISLNVAYYVYMLITKGNTIGRKIMKIELKGHVTWYSLLMREILWKHFFWLFPLTLAMAFNFGIVFFLLPICLFIDITLIVFSKKRRTLRDTFSKTYLTPVGVNYPF